MWTVALSFLKGISLRTWLIVAAVALLGVWHWNEVRIARNQGRAEIQVKLDEANRLLAVAADTIKAGERLQEAQAKSLQDCIGQRTMIADLADAAVAEAKRANAELVRKLGTKMDRLAAAQAKPECAALLETDADALCGL